MPPSRSAFRIAAVSIGMFGFVAVTAFAFDAAAGESPISETPKPEATAAEIEFFERKIRPLLAKRCFECHSAESDILQGGLRLDSGAAIHRGGDSGPALVAGRPDESLLVQAVRFDGYEMPPDGRLPASEIELLEEWVRRGAPMPSDRDSDDVVAGTIDIEAGRDFWSFRPLTPTTPPAVVQNDWPARPLDGFILAELERAGLSPAPEADHRTLLRRVSFDLAGLPPSPEELERFLSDPAPDAYAKVVDELLASPHYGERWGRHWLDLARYTDAMPSWVSDRSQAWVYRDWIVAALNSDLPYDDFVRRQLAADKMADAVPADNAALGFLGLSPVYWKELKLDKEVIKGTVAEEWEERIDAVGRTFLGLTLACARCHDHKFDPVAVEDYYALAGVLANTRLTDRPLIPDDDFAVVEQARKDVAALEAKIKELAKAKSDGDDAKRQIEALKTQIDDLRRTTAHYAMPTAFGVDDAALSVEADGPDLTKLVYRPGEARDLHVQIRGNPSNPGEVAPRRFLSVLSDGEPRPLSHGSGRLDLAEAIVSDAAPLAARVIVNRVWRQHFGKGLVETASDFGNQGTPPSHPELLDHLASRFIEQGWSLKWLHREIVLSATYRQASSTASEASERLRTVDPENRLLSHMNRRRLDVEAWRDAVLTAAGVLDRTIGGPPQELSQAKNRRRTVYGRIDRYDLNDLLRLYDFPDPLGHSPGREPTTTALQQLFVLNSDFMQQHAASLAGRTIEERSAATAAAASTTTARETSEQIRQIYRLLFQRRPDDDELRLGKAYLAAATGDGGTIPSEDAWRQYAQSLLATNEFLFVD